MFHKEARIYRKRKLLTGFCYVYVTLVGNKQNTGNTSRVIYGDFNLWMLPAIIMSGIVD